MKQHLLPLALLVMALLTSCSSDSFKIDGDLINLDGDVVRVVMRGDSGLVDESVEMDEKGHFSFQGIASQPVLVAFMRLDGSPLATVVAANGDHIKLKADARQPASVRIKGGKVNDQWQMFRDEHLDFYLNSNPGRLDAAIEKYVKEHPADMLSTVLLMADYSDYSDRDKVEKLLKSIEAKARPESLTAAFWELPASATKRQRPRLMNLNLLRHGGGFEQVELTNRISLLWMWANPQDGRQEVRQRIKDFCQDVGKDVRIIDILTESDTMRWYQNIAGEEWKHYWAPGGPLEKGIQLLGINTMPWYAVTDSTGMVIYSGPDLTSAFNTATAHVKASKSTKN